MASFIRICEYCRIFVIYEHLQTTASIDFTLHGLSNTRKALAITLKKHLLTVLADAYFLKNSTDSYLISPL